MRVAVAVLVLAGALAAGCVAPSAPPPAPASEPEQEPARSGFVELFPFSGYMTAGAGKDGVLYVAPLGESEQHMWPFQVGEGTVALMAELRWPDATQDLDLQLAPPGCDLATGTGPCIYLDAGRPGQGDTPMRILIDDETVTKLAGEWYAAVWAKAGAQVDFAVAVSVFYDVPPDEAYTAFGDGA